MIAVKPWKIITKEETQFLMMYMDLRLEHFQPAEHLTITAIFAFNPLSAKVSELNHK